jgi:hypothetical protein
VCDRARVPSGSQPEHADKSAVINVVNGSDLTSLSDINDRHRLCKTVCMPYDFDSKLCTTEDALGKLMASRNSAIYCSDAK